LDLAIESLNQWLGPIFLSCSTQSCHGSFCPYWFQKSCTIAEALQWNYLYRAVDKQRRTVDFLLSKHRDKAAAIRFFRKAIGNHQAPEKVTLDGYEATHRAVAEMKSEGVLPPQTEVRTNKYLNNLIEQDHRRIKQRYYPMLGFKKFGNAAVTLSGIELAAKIKKEQFDTSTTVTQPGTTILQVWESVLAA